MVVDGEGTANLCHDLETRVWHNGAPGANTTRLSVCWTGNTTPTSAQINGMARCVEWLEGKLGHALEVRGHKDAPYATTCPGATWAQWKPDLMAVIGAL